jgi:hypothetical protein
MTAIYAVLALAVAYILFVKWRMAQPIEIYYHTFWSPLLRRVLPGMAAISLWRTVLMLYPPYVARGRLSVSGKIHEVKGHIQNPDQWAGHPYTFPLRYLIEQIRHGYDGNKYEEQARRIAGEPTRAAP